MAKRAKTLAEVFSAQVTPQDVSYADDSVGEVEHHMAKNICFTRKVGTSEIVVVKIFRDRSADYVLIGGTQKDRHVLGEQLLDAEEEE